MKGWARLFVGLGLPIILAATITWWQMPHLIEALPGQYRHYVPEVVLQRFTTPLPTALPAPALSAVPQITVPPLQPLLAIDTAPAPAASTPAATAGSTITLPPTFTPVGPATAASGSDMSATATSTPEPAEPRPVDPPPVAQPPAAARIEGLAIIPQKFNNCGPTNLTINLNFYGLSVTQLDVAAAVKPNTEDRNVGPWEMAAYVNEQTPLAAAVFSGGDLVLLRQLIADGFPVVIEKGLVPSEWQGWMGHYLTLYGYDDQSALFYSMDTLLGPWDGSGRIDTYDEIAAFWHHFNHTFLVIYPPERETALHRILGPGRLDPATMWQEAALRAQEQLATEPEDAFAWFNLGTSLTRMGQLTGSDILFRDAALAFDQARTIGLPARMLWYQFQPYEAYLKVGRPEDVLQLAEATLASQGGRNVEETYLYRGLALEAMGERRAATLAFQEALRLNRNFATARKALNRLLASG